MILLGWIETKRYQVEVYVPIQFNLSNLGIFNRTDQPRSLGSHPVSNGNPSFACHVIEHMYHIYIHNKSIWSKLHIHAVQNRHVYLSTVWISIGPADEQKDQVMSLYSRRSACLGVRRLREQIAAASSPIFFGKAKRNGKNDIQLGQYSWVVDLLKIFGLIGSSDAWSRGFCWWFEQEVLGDCHDVGILNCDNTHTHTKTKKTHCMDWIIHTTILPLPRLRLCSWTWELEGYFKILLLFVIRMSAGYSAHSSLYEIVCKSS